MDRALKFLNRTSASWPGVVAAGAGVTAEESGGVVAAADAAGDAAVSGAGVRLISSSCAGARDEVQTPRAAATMTMTRQECLLINSATFAVLSVSV